MINNKKKNINSYYTNNIQISKLKFYKIVFFIFLFLISPILCNAEIEKDNNSLHDYKSYKLPNYITPRIRPSAVMLRDGNILFTGGETYHSETEGYHSDKIETLSDSEIFNINQKKFTKTSNLNISRIDHSMALLSNGNILVVGGFSKQMKKASKRIKTAEIYDPKNNKFNLISEMNYHMIRPNMLLLNNGDVLVFYNPNRIELFNSKENNFSIIKGLSLEKDYIRYEYIKINNNEILMYPQTYIPNETPIVKLNLNDLTLKILDIPLFDKKREYYNIAQINEDEYLVTGGDLHAGGGYKEAKIINIKTKQEKAVPDMHCSRYLHKSIRINKNHIIITGGLTGANYSLKELKDIEVYIVDENRFKQIFHSKFAGTANYIKLQNNNYLIFKSYYQSPEILIRR